MTEKMKKFAIVLLAMLFLQPVALMAQSGKKTTKEVSPFIEGKKKVRRVDYDSIWKFTTFDQKKVYFNDFDYTQFPEMCEHRNPDWGSFQPVMNFLQTQPRTPVRMVAVYAINPNIKEASQRNALIAQAQQEALECIQTFAAWCTNKEMKNKMQLFVAQVDYRYWQGTDFFVNQQTNDAVIHVGLVLFFGTKKIDLFPSAAADARTFHNIKFFPNDATVQESYDPMLDELAQYLLENERYEVMLRGYTDNIGTDAYCIGLSRQRCVEVKKKLIARGVPEYRIEIEAKGSSDPIGDNNDYEGRISNNRVSIEMQ